VEGADTLLWAAWYAWVGEEEQSRPLRYRDYAAAREARSSEHEQVSALVGLRARPRSHYGWEVEAELRPLPCSLSQLGHEKGEVVELARLRHSGMTALSVMPVKACCYRGRYRGQARGAMHQG
jgi:hypothetical protein